MIEKVERFIFYPVLVIATLLALQSWSIQPLWFSSIASIAVAVLWLTPILRGKLVPFRRILFWVVLVVLILGLLWIYAWSRV
jgi:hypothetical protein